MSESKKENLICGVTKEYIRKAFFNNKIGALLSEIQSDREVTETDLKELTDFLETLKSQGDKNLKTVLDVFGGTVVGTDEIKPPGVDVLYKNLSEGEKKEFEEWKKNVDKALKFVKEAMTQASTDVFKKVQVSKDTWIDWALEIVALSRWIDEDRVYKDQLFRKRMTEIIDKYEISRKEAEERAKLTPEYRDYKLATLAKDNIDEFIRLCKKRGGYEFTN